MTTKTAVPLQYRLAASAARLFQRNVFVPLLVALLCAWALATQAMLPWKLDVSLFTAQAVAMAVGVFVLAAVCWRSLAERFQLPEAVQNSILAMLALTELVLAWHGLGRSWIAISLGWMTLPLLVLLTLRTHFDKQNWLRSAPMCGAWLLLIAASIPDYGVRAILVPLIALLFFMPFWKGNWRLGALLTTAIGIWVTHLIAGHAWQYDRIIRSFAYPDPQGMNYVAFRVRHILAVTGWTGTPSLRVPCLPNVTTHIALILFGARWGGLGLLLWFGAQAWLLVRCFRQAYAHRGQTHGDLLAALTFVLLVVTLASLSFSLGFPGYGVALPLLGLDPGLTLLTLLTLALMQRVRIAPASIARESETT
jgi:hypothetical protein